MTYVGLCDGKIVKIDSNYHISDSHQARKGLHTLAVCEDTLLTICSSSPSARRRFTSVIHYKLGEQCVRINEWAVNRDQLCVVADKVVVLDTKYKQLRICSALTGKLIRIVPCAKIVNGSTVLCASSDNSIVISDRDVLDTQLHTIHIIDINSGKVKWSLFAPHVGATMYERWLLVSRRGQISVFNVEQGLFHMYIKSAFVHYKLGPN